MSAPPFDPTLGLDPRAPLDPGALVAGRLYHDGLPPLARPGDISRGYLHVSAGPRSVCFADYTANVALVNDVWVTRASHDPRPNAWSTWDPDTYAAATLARNRGSFSVCADCDLGATPYDLGPQGLQLHQVERVCAAAAALCAAYGVDPLGTAAARLPDGTADPYAGEPNVLTHAEAADLPGTPEQYDPYGPASTCERWDFLALGPLPPDWAAPSDAMARATGDWLRTRISTYALAIP